MYLAEFTKHLESSQVAEMSAIRTLADKEIINVTTITVYINSQREPMLLD